MARILTFALGAFAIGVACYVSTIEHILKASSSFLDLFAAPILALFLMGLFTRRGKFWGWVCGTIPAVATTLWVQNSSWTIDGEEQKVHWIYYYPHLLWDRVVPWLPGQRRSSGPVGQSGNDTVWTQRGVGRGQVRVGRQSDRGAG